MNHSSLLRLYATRMPATATPKREEIKKEFPAESSASRKVRTISRRAENPAAVATRKVEIGA
jgi:hypothetical protein